MAKTAKSKLEVSSSAFQNQGKIPAKYTCDGDGINPPLHIGPVPDRTKTLALIVEDPDAPGGTYDHWIVWNIPVTETIRENSNPGTSGNNTSGKTGYHPPCPPKGSHRYYFYVFALDAELDLMVGESKEALQEVMKPHILAEGSLMGKFR